MEKNLTTGSVFRNIVGFSLPYLLAYFLQTLYGMADLFITGQFSGTADITAVSIGSQVMHMMTVMIVGLAMGTTIAIGRAVGGREQEKAALAIGNSATLFIGLSVVLTVILLALVRPIVAVMSTPAEAVEGTVRYLTICFIGIPFITAYNIISSIFRGLGDSQSPMKFVAVACAANILLDYLFIGGMHLGPAGAALGTTLSQTLSVVVSLVMVTRQKSALPVTRASFRPRKDVLGSILKVGVPVALQDGFIQISFLLITVIANGRGLDDAAAVGIVEKVISFVFLVPSSMLSTVSALAAQNIGAGRYDRAAQTLRYAVGMCLCFGLVVGTIVQFAAGGIVSVFDSTPAVVTAGSQYIRGYIWDCMFAGAHFSCSGYFCAYGRSGVSFLHNALSIVLVRIPGAYLMSRLFPSTLLPMGCAATAGSLLSVIICVIALVWLRRRGALDHPVQV